MSKFKETLEELNLTGYFADSIYTQTLMDMYDKSEPDKQAALDKHPLLLIEKLASHNSDFRNNITSIKKNLQFISWFLIISIVIVAVFTLAELS